MTNGYSLFDTAVGRCGVAWGEGGLIAVQLPQPNEGQTRTRLAQRCGGTGGMRAAAACRCGDCGHDRAAGR